MMHSRTVISLSLSLVPPGQHPDYATTAHTLTTCDTDSLFHPLYFDTVEAEYNADNPSLDQVFPCVYQPSMHYNWFVGRLAHLHLLASAPRTVRRHCAVTVVPIPIPITAVTFHLET